MRSRKETAWKKNRKFGDVHGGRRRPKLADNLFRRLHSLKPPAPGQPTPIVIEDNPSRDFFFPLTGAEALDALRTLPADQVRGITHLWLRRLKGSEHRTGARPWAEFVCCSGVRAVILYAWPEHRLLPLGRKVPKARVLERYSRWSTDLVQDAAENWCLRFSTEGLRRFYVEDLLYHEVGHHVDLYTRRWSKANRRKLEEFAVQYAFQMSERGPFVHREEDGGAER